MDPTCVSGPVSALVRRRWKLPLFCCVFFGGDLALLQWWISCLGAAEKWGLILHIHVDPARV